MTHMPFIFSLDQFTRTTNHVVKTAAEFVFTSPGTKGERGFSLTFSCNDTSNIKMKLFFALALFVASAFAGNSASTSFTGPAELVKHFAEHTDNGARGLNAFDVCKDLS